jgi:hypothetical protein
MTLMTMKATRMRPRMVMQNALTRDAIRRHGGSSPCSDEVLALAGILKTRPVYGPKLPVGR